MKDLKLTVWVALMLFGLVSASYAQTTVRVVGLTSISKAPPLVVAQAKGLYDKAGVKVEQKLIAEGRVAIEGLAAGQFDIGMFGDIPGLSLLARGFPGKVVAAGLGGPAREAVLVRNDSSYKSLRELKGKKIGLTRGSTNELVFEAILKKEGLSWEDFNIVNLRHEDKPQALQLGQVDATIAWEPGPAIVVVKGIGRRLVTGDGYMDDNLGVLIASDDILKRDPDAVIRFLRALHEASVYAHTYPDEMVELLAERLKLDKAVLVQAIPTQWWYIEVFADTLPNWQLTVDLLTKLKRSDKPLQLSEVTNFSYLSKALNKTYPLKQKARDVIRYPVVSARR